MGWDGHADGERQGSVPVHAGPDLGRSVIVPRSEGALALV